MARAADFNNDGRLDFAISDKLTSSGELSGFGLWHNNNKGAFSLWPIAAAYVPAEMAWGDFDNDDDLDLVTSYWDSGVNTRFQLIRNNGDETFSGPLDGSFGIGGSGLRILSVVWGDFNNDGWLDLFYVSNELNGFAAPTIMLKGDGSFFLYTGASLDEPFSVGRTVISADIDNDGYRDLLVSASNPWVEMYHNNGDFSFTRLQIGWTGGTQNASSFGDFNGDGKLDVLITHLFGTNAVAEIWLNNTAISNTPPTAPTDLMSAVSNGVVRFSWSAASDAQNTNAAGLSYNLRVGTTPGGVDVMSPAADPVTGQRRILEMGNTQMGLTGLLRVGPGRYYWSVQAIDEGLAGGPFAAEQSFWGGGAPQIEMVNAGAILNGSATLHSTFYPGELATTVYFQYGPTISYGQSTPPQSVGLHGLLTFQQTITGLAAGIYHYRVVATNSAGVTFGADQIFENINVLGGDGNNDGLVDAGEVNRALSNYWSQSVVYMTDPKRLAGGQFQFALTNMVGWNFNVQGSSDLNNWTNLTTTAAPVYQFADADGTNAAPRYYRLR